MNIITLIQVENVPRLLLCRYQVNCRVFSNSLSQAVWWESIKCSSELHTSPLTILSSAMPKGISYLSVISIVQRCLPFLLNTAISSPISYFSSSGSSSYQSLGSHVQVFNPAIISSARCSSFSSLP